jgi:hypothetical protein
MRTLKERVLKPGWFAPLIILVVAFVTMLPVLIKGLPTGHDLPHHYQCATTFCESILSGDLYPSWSLNRNFGYGGMETRLYPPLAHYSLAVVYLLIGDWHIASWLVFMIFAFVGGLGVYLWAREYMSPAQAVFAGCIYVLLPYHLNQLYNTFFYAEFVGSSILPFIFVFTSRVCRRGNYLDVAGLAISYAVLVLTHLPLTVMGSISCAIYGMLLLERPGFSKQIGKLGAGVAMGLAASSFFWVKVLQEKDLMAKATVYADGWLNYQLNFLITPLQTYTTNTELEVYQNGTYFYDQMLFYVVIMVAGCMVPFWRRGNGSSLLPLWVLLGMSAFLSTLLSKPVWDNVTFLQEIQFPWRWLALVSVVAPVVAAGKTGMILKAFRDKRRPLALIATGSILMVIAFSASQIVRPALFMSRDTVAPILEKNSKDIGLTFWWTIWARKEALDIRDKVQAEGRPYEIQNWSATDRQFTVSGGSGNAVVRIATFFHPNWQAMVNGVPVVTGPDAGGAITLPIPAEESSVKLNFVETPVLKVADAVSVSTWLVLAMSIFCFLCFRRSILP